MVLTMGIHLKCAVWLSKKCGAPLSSHLINRISFELRRILRQGLFVFLQKLFLLLISITIWFVLLPATAVLHIIGYRRINVFVDRIGHLAIEPDCLLKEERLGLINGYKWFILAPPKRTANKHLLNYWKPLIRIYENNLICFVLGSMSRWGLMTYDISKYTLARKTAQATYRVYAKWGDHPPLLKLSEADEIYCVKALSQLGIPDGAWFACVHAREPGFSPIDEELQSHRNSSIEATTLAIKKITDCGGWVIRIGGGTTHKLPEMDRVIDYAHHPLKSGRLDVIFCAKARFILGNTSGISLVASIFGVPCALANMIPFPALALGAKDVSIPKLIWAEEESRYIQYSDIINSPISRFMYAKQYRENKIIVEENSPEDIRLLVVEMIKKLEGADLGVEDLSSKVLNNLEKHHYGYGSIASISNYFIRNHEALFSKLISGSHNHNVSRDIQHDSGIFKSQTLENSSNEK